MALVNEVVVGSAVIGGAEVLIAALTAWHGLVDVYVDATSDPVVEGSQWNLYAITAGTRTRIASGVFDAPDPLQGQRVLSAVPGEGTTIELWAFTPHGASSGPVRAAIVGWDPGTSTATPTDAVDAAINIASGLVDQVVVAMLPWHPYVSCFVQALPLAVGSQWTIRANMGGLFTANVPIASGTFGDVQASRVVCQGQGGAASWSLTVSTPAGGTGACTVALFGKTTLDSPATDLLSNVPPVNVTKLPASAGVALAASRSDHKHDITTAVPVSVGSVNQEGTAESLARSDHVHASTGVSVSGLTTTGLGNGDFGYISATETVTKTDGDALPSARVFGANEGTVGSMTVVGVVVLAKFTTVGGAPTPGSPVYLAPGTEEGGAAGKLTATAPVAVGKFLAEVGICYDATAYAGAKTARVLLQPKAVIAL